MELRDVTKTYPAGSVGLWRRLAGARDVGGHRALDGVSLAVARGECVGVLGVNGAGKSTLLGIVTGTLRPTAGTVRLRGSVAPLLELGAGFDPAWTARRNVEFQARVADVPASRMAAHIAAVREFADVGDFFDEPMRTFSSGMFLRVAFAAAVTADPDILIVDEALAVGDAKFQTKCYARIEELRREGRTVLFVTHSPEVVSRLCTRGLILQGGRIAFDGSPDEATRRYLADLYGPARPAPGAEEAPAAAALPELGGRLEERAFYNPHERRTGDGRGRILDAALRRPAAASAPHVIPTGERVTVALRVEAEAAVRRPTIGFVVRTVDNVAIYGSSSHMLGVELPPIAAGGGLDVELSFRCALAPGECFLDLGFAEVVEGRQQAVDFRLAAIHLYVTGSATAFGIADLEGRIGLAGP